MGEHAPLGSPAPVGSAHYGPPAGFQVRVWGVVTEIPRGIVIPILRSSNSALVVFYAVGELVQDINAGFRIGNILNEVPRSVGGRVGVFRPTHLHVIQVRGIPGGRYVRARVKLVR
ncbi:MAG: hypothetical protein RBG13Loki_3593 [Promethearchaeota archaeon CR_4]|nr:MAG: hypothetical protein RBG13Loki_3593 [Candidatus Lokiarchaeota archaeon CR_4]